jgi:hypothetical protein
MKTIYSYYRSIATSPQAEEFACANWWKTTWEKNGWATCMLNSTHAQASSLYAKLTKKLTSVSSNINPAKSKGYEYFNVRFVRWCALHAAGGGWMCDYDVANKSGSNKPKPITMEGGSHLKDNFNTSIRHIKKLVKNHNK